jgi:hypothetical protein
MSHLEEIDVAIAYHEQCIAELRRERDKTEESLDWVGPSMEAFVEAWNNTPYAKEHGPLLKWNNQTRETETVVPAEILNIGRTPIKRKCVRCEKELEENEVVYWSTEVAARVSPLMQPMCKECAEKTYQENKK